MRNIKPSGNTGKCNPLSNWAQTTHCEHKKMDKTYIYQERDQVWRRNDTNNLHRQIRTRDRSSNRIFSKKEAYPGRQQDIFQSNTWQRPHNNHAESHNRRWWMDSPVTHTTLRTTREISSVPNTHYWNITITKRHYVELKRKRHFFTFVVCLGLKY